MLVVDSFVKSYHGEQILSIESLSLPVGCYFVKGENGSGKTTFFKCLAGITPFQGDITFNRLSVTKDPVAYRYAVNFAEAEPLYPGYLTARDLMLFVGKTKRATKEQLEKYKEQLGIGWFYDKSCGTYSSGMLKKLSLALAFLGNPGMIILDEPLITLDQETRKSLFLLMQDKKDTLFFLSSHQSLLDEVPTLSATFKIQNKKLVAE
ncbi:MAG: ATP-binding cassette domain-containing protein [Bacteroidota bacterium]|nr:ATP-binding cassette domain-containing protein [Bacteroidota bacterium]